MAKSFATRRLYSTRSELKPLLWATFGFLLALLVISYLPLILATISLAMGIRPALASL